MEGGAPSAVAGFIFFLASSSFSNFSLCVILERQKMYFESKCYVRKMGRYVKYTTFVNSFFLFLLIKNNNMYIISTYLTNSISWIHWSQGTLTLPLPVTVCILLISRSSAFVPALLAGNGKSFGTDFPTALLFLTGVSVLLLGFFFLSFFFFPLLLDDDSTSVVSLSLSLAFCFLFLATFFLHLIFLCFSSFKVEELDSELSNSLLLKHVSLSL